MQVNDSDEVLANRKKKKRKLVRKRASLITMKGVNGNYDAELFMDIYFTP